MRIIKYLFLCLALVSAPVTAQDDNFELWMDNELSVTADGTSVVYITVSQYDPDKNYLGFNMELVLPKGFKVHQVKSGRGYKNDIELSVRATETHTISCNMPDAGTLKIACISTQNQELYPDDVDGNPYYPLFTVGIVAETSVINGVYDVEMSGISFTWRNTDGALVQKAVDKLEQTCAVTVTGGRELGGVDYTIPAEGCGTMILPYNTGIPAGMKVYECCGVTAANTLDLSEVTAISANTPYIVCGTPGTYHFDGTYRALKPYYATAFMTGVYEEMEVPAGAYVMQKHPSKQGAGFYRVESVKTTVSPYHSWLNAQPDYAGVLELDFTGTTGIGNDVESCNVKVNIYNAKGQLIRSSVKRSAALKGLEHGVYIIGNEKVLVE